MVDRLGAELQQEGSMIFGVGSALHEGLAWDGGQLVNGNLSDYEIPSIGDLPALGYERRLLPPRWAVAPDADPGETTR